MNYWYECHHCDCFESEILERDVRSKELEAQTKWHPINSEDDLPKESGFYLVSLPNNNVDICYFAKNKRWKHIHLVSPKVTAWVEMPEAYKEDE